MCSIRDDVSSIHPCLHDVILEPSSWMTKTSATSKNASSDPPRTDPLLLGAKNPRLYLEDEGPTMIIPLTRNTPANLVLQGEECMQKPDRFPWNFKFLVNHFFLGGGGWVVKAKLKIFLMKLLKKQSALIFSQKKKLQSLWNFMSESFQRSFLTRCELVKRISISHSNRAVKLWRISGSICSKNC